MSDVINDGRIEIIEGEVELVYIGQSDKYEQG